MTQSEPAKAARALAVQLLGILHKDRPRLRRIDDYLHGRHDDPYMPPNADDEYKLLAKRSVTNVCNLVVSTPAQAMYVDSFRRGRDRGSETIDSANTPEWRHWQYSRLDARQSPIHRGALNYGHSFSVTEKDKKGKVVTRGLSALKTSAVFEDPANDIVPAAALTVTREPVEDENGTPGKAILWDGTRKYEVSFEGYTDKSKVSLGAGILHGSSECPVTRFAAAVDLEGRTVGVVEPIIPLQNRINQTVFDLLVGQTYGSQQVRYATGMAPPMEMEPVYENPEDANSEIVGYKPKLDATGNPVPRRVNHNARRFLFAEDPEVKFGSLEGTPLEGFIASLDMSWRHLAAITQLPPHHLLGQIANLSAEALLAAETALSRMVEEFRKAFGESWERVFQLAAELAGDSASEDDFSGEVLWRDMEQRSMAQAADALGKLREQLGIPARGLWSRVPGVTGNELARWEELREDEDGELLLAQSLRRATPDRPAAPVA